VIIPTGYAQANLRFTGVALPLGAEITQGHDVGAFIGDPSDLADLVATAWGLSGLNGMQVSEVALTSVEVKYGPNATGPSGLWTGLVTGAVSGDSVEPNTAALVHKKTAFGGRAGSGRFYIPGIADSTVSNAGVITGTTVAAYNGWLAAYLSGFSPVDADLVLLHGEGSPITTPTPVTSLECDARVATQRRRLRR
jgi:hypothetical protein